jgi:iron(III) transport system permease protein
VSDSERADATTLAPAPSGSFPAWLAGTVLLLTLLVPLPPVALTLWASATRPDAWAGLVRHTGRLGGLAANTLLVSAGVMMVSLLAGYALAATLVRFRHPLRLPALVTLAMVGVTPSVALVSGWQGIFGWPDLTDGRWPGLVDAGRWGSVIALLSLVALPGVVAILAAGLARLPADAEDQELLRRSFGSLLWWRAPAQLRPTLMAAALVAVWPPLSDMSVTDLYRFRTLVEESYIEFRIGGEAPTASLVSLLLGLIIAGLASGPLLTLVSRPADRPPAPTRPIRATELPWFALAGLSVLLPLSPLVGNLRQLGLETVSAPVRTDPATSAAADEPATKPRGNSVAEAAAGPNGSPEAGGGALGAWSLTAPPTTGRWNPATALRALTQAARTDTDTLVRSLLFALGSSGLTLSLAVPLAWGLRLGGPALRRTLLIALVQLMLLPGPVLGITMLDLFGKSAWLDPIYDGPGIVVLGQTLRMLPLVTFGVFALFRRIPDDVFEAESLAGRTGVSLLGRAVRDARGGIAALLPIGAALALTELPVTLLVAPPGYDLVCPRIFELIHSGAINQVAALCLMQMTLSGLLLASGLGVAAFVERRRILNSATVQGG